MDCLGRVWTNLARQLDDTIMRLTNSLCLVWTNFRLRYMTDHAPAPQFSSLVFVVSSLLNLLQLNTQGNPFLTHPIAINTAISSLLIYGLASDIEQRFSYVRNARIYSNIVLRVFGSLLIASLASIFLPTAIQPLPYVVYIFVYAAGPYLQNWLQRRLMRTQRTEVGGTQNARLPV